MDDHLLANMPSPDDFTDSDGSRAPGQRWQYAYVIIGSANWFEAMQGFGAQGFEVVPVAFGYNVVVMKR